MQSYTSEHIKACFLSYNMNSIYS